MGTLHLLPATRKDRPTLRLQDPCQITPDLTDQFVSLQTAVEVQLPLAVGRFEKAVADVDAIGHQLPSGEFKDRFDEERGVLAAQLNQIRQLKSDLQGIWTSMCRTLNDCDVK
ncbi:hypothetical protein JQ596_09055 [Bradyrhizobium manausense]|uniref:hypothetical protein n=1 Tax=Bradyrhizobium TaxID=374 RepID=UPI001BA9719E|nr:MULTISPECIES: hypothetical protein [Bradyrhizobium]MBR0825685.1 hypothetical protein [Bradyrhizobium manausense]UVO31365.1 hypothetical protein KUF59_12290 [Bradyrhizobium arachidis]